MKYKPYTNKERFSKMVFEGKTRAEINAESYAIKKAERENASVTLLWDGKWDELAYKWGASRGTK